MCGVILSKIKHQATFLRVLLGELNKSLGSDEVVKFLIF